MAEGETKEGSSVISILDVAASVVKDAPFQRGR